MSQEANSKSDCETGEMDINNYDVILERMPEMEEWHGVRFDHLSAVYDRGDKTLRIFCEVHPTKGVKLKYNIDFIIVMYDKKERIVGRNHSYLAKSEFYNFEVVELGLYDLTPKKLEQVGKIKVFPAKW